MLQVVSKNIIYNHFIIILFENMKQHQRLILWELLRTQRLSSHHDAPSSSSDHHHITIISSYHQNHHHHQHIIIIVIVKPSYHHTLIMNMIFNPSIMLTDQNAHLTDILVHQVINIINYTSMIQSSTSWSWLLSLSFTGWFFKCPPPLSP